MNTEIENNEKALAVAMSAETIEASQAINNTLTTACVRAHFQAHYANAEIDVYGILSLVKDILRDKQAEFPRGIEATALRQIAVAASMFTSEILAEVESRFAAGGLRYKVQAVKNVLSTYGSNKTYKKGPKAGYLIGDSSIGKITLTNEEDQPRDCSKPRAKWYRIQGKE